MASAAACALVPTKPWHSRALFQSSPSLIISNNPIKMRGPQVRQVRGIAKAEFDLAFFEREMESPPPPDKEEPQCPPGLRKYETMVVLRPDMSEEERLGFTQKYEELVVAGGGMYVEVFNRGVIPLAYSIRKKNKAGESNTYLDGIYLLFTYFTNPDSISILSQSLLADDDVVRSSTFKIRKRKLF